MPLETLLKVQKEKPDSGAKRRNVEMKKTGRTTTKVLSFNSSTSKANRNSNSNGHSRSSKSGDSTSERISSPNYQRNLARLRNEADDIDW